MNTAKYIAKNVKRLRNERKITLQELAAATNISEHYLQRIENEDAKGLKLYHIEVFCKAFGVEPRDILN
ncbi:helix-turn-helix transcriptional regulator [bacterium]|nr:helix-turn-helix transcriptional regulator [bacterium]